MMTGRDASALRRIASAVAVWAFSAAVFASVLSGCARPGPPGGGPPDTIRPEIVSTSPACGETDVDTLCIVRIDFSEDMHRSSVEEAFTITPQLDLKNFRWRKWSLVVEPRAALADSTTFVATVGQHAADLHDVNMAEPHCFAFSTGPVVDSGIISGLVTSAGVPLSGSAVWACYGDVTADSLGAIDRCGYATVSSDSGAFRFDYMKAAPRPYSLVALVDRNGNNVYEVGEETGTILTGAALITSPGDSVGGLELKVTAPKAPAAEAEEQH